MYFFRCKTARQIAKTWPLAGDVWFFQYHLAPQTHDIFPFFGTGWIATCCDVAGCTGCNDLVDFHIRLRRSEAFDSAETRVDRFRPWRCHPLAWHSWVSPTLCWARQCSAFILMASVTNSNCKNAMVSTSWTLHGLWPEWQNECEGPDFDENVLKDIHDEMEKKWPSCPEYGESEQEFWSHEWKKHGTCSGMGQLEYFKKALQMRDEYMNKCSKEGNQCSVCFGKNLTSQETCPTFTVSVWGILREGLRGSWLHGALAAALAAPSPPRLCCCKWHHTC